MPLAAKDSDVIRNLILRGVSSYSPTLNSQIGPLTQVNMFYGHNGTGKTTIGNYLQDPSDLLYHQCQTQPASVDRDVLVYNHTFMDANFQASSQPGIFTLNEGNIEAEKELEAAELALKQLLTEHQAEVGAGNAFGESQKANKVDMLDQLWALKSLSIPALSGIASSGPTPKSALEKSYVISSSCQRPRICRVGG